MREHLARFDDHRRPAQVKINSQQGRSLDLQPGHPDRAFWLVQLMDTFGTSETSTADWLLGQVINATHVAGKDEPIREKSVNAALAAINSLAPRDEAEAMLVAQMVAVHASAMDLLRQMNGATIRHHFEGAGNLAVKLLRIYTAQIEALTRYRHRGEQKVTVEHVHVHPGGQAIVGAVTTRGPGGMNKSEDQPHAKQITHAPGETLPSAVEAHRESVPFAGG